MKNFYIVDHPLIKKDLTILRDKNTQPEIFRSALQRISNLLAAEISKNIILEQTEIETPLEKTIGYKLKKQIVLVPVLRAGLGMVNGFLELIPDSKVGHMVCREMKKLWNLLNITSKLLLNLKNRILYFLIQCWQPVEALLVLSHT